VLARRGRRVLAVDVDPQFAMTRRLGVQPHRLASTVVDVLAVSDSSSATDGADARPRRCFAQTDMPVAAIRLLPWSVPERRVAPVDYCSDGRPASRLRLLDRARSLAGSLQAPGAVLQQESNARERPLGTCLRGRADLRGRRESMAPFAGESRAPSASRALCGCCSRAHTRGLARAGKS
jgi:hypothetical protein